MIYYFDFIEFFFFFGLLIRFLSNIMQAFDNRLLLNFSCYISFKANNYTQLYPNSGVHFGHGSKKWNPRKAPCISAKKHKCTRITNLTGSASFLSETCYLIFDAASREKKTS